VLLSLAACTQEELPGNQDKAQQLTFSVTDGGYTSAVRKTTRTVENGCQTKFSEGGPAAYTWCGALKQSIPT